MSIVRLETLSHADQSRWVLDRCRDLGFALSGVCESAPTQYEHELIEWLAAGKHGEMEYLRRNIELRIDPAKLVPGAKSVICVADRYQSVTPECGDSQVDQPIEGKIARYARGDDYHEVMRKRLTILARELSQMFPHETFRACVDTAPVLERELAQRAGIGAVGKNTLIIERGVGSYLLLGEIITTLELGPSTPAEPDPCGTCTRCIDACPTKAIAREGFSLDATRCISYLTIEHRSEIDQQFHKSIGDWIFGCDICQEVCPHNQPTLRSVAQMEHTHPAYAPRNQAFDLLEILNWDEAARRNAFTQSSMKRARLEMMKRNALIAAGNMLMQSHDSCLFDRIVLLANDATQGPLVRETAIGIVDRIMHREVKAGAFDTAAKDS
jgi:epoxyqueuosine reductase